MLWRACNLFAALVVCVFLERGEGSERVGFMSERAKTYAFAIDVALGNHEGASERNVASGGCDAFTGKGSTYTYKQ